MAGQASLLCEPAQRFAEQASPATDSSQPRRRGRNRVHTARSLHCPARILLAQTPASAQTGNHNHDTKRCLGRTNRHRLRDHERQPFVRLGGERPPRQADAGNRETVSGHDGKGAYGRSDQARLADPSRHSSWLNLLGHSIRPCPPRGEQLTREAQRLNDPLCPFIPYAGPPIRAA